METPENQIENELLTKID